MPKKTRQEIIKTILNANIVETQEQLVELLKQANVTVTQATVSRDIKEMQLVKVPIRAGRYRYSLPVMNSSSKKGDSQHVVTNALREVRSLDKFVDLKLTPGSGPAVASILQARKDKRIFSIVPTDSTILIICYTDVQAKALATELDIIAG